MSNNFDAALKDILKDTPGIVDEVQATLDRAFRRNARQNKKYNKEMKEAVVERFVENYIVVDAEGDAWVSNNDLMRSFLYVGGWMPDDFDPDDSCMLYCILSEMNTFTGKKVEGVGYGDLLREVRSCLGERRNRSDKKFVPHSGLPKPVSGLSGIRIPDGITPDGDAAMEYERVHNMLVEQTRDRFAAQERVHGEYVPNV